MAAGAAQPLDPRHAPNRSDSNGRGETALWRWENRTAVWRRGESVRAPRCPDLRLRGLAPVYRRAESFFAFRLEVQTVSLQNQPGRSLFVDLVRPIIDTGRPLMPIKI